MKCVCVCVCVRACARATRKDRAGILVSPRSCGGILARAISCAMEELLRAIARTRTAGFIRLAADAADVRVNAVFGFVWVALHGGVALPRAAAAADTQVALHGTADRELPSRVARVGYGPKFWSKI